jgi:ABC-type nitrate/sulfonate/bicarbonate transport system permease component
MGSPFISWGFIVLLWILLPYWEGPHFSLLPRPLGVIRSFGMLWTDYDLLGNVFMSWWRIAQAFFWCAVIAIPLGILMSSYRWLFELINPVAAPMRAMPLTAFLPAFIALFGIDETRRLRSCGSECFSTCWQWWSKRSIGWITPLLETAYTLGAKQAQVLWLVFRASFPAIFSSFRILYDIGWTYVILAEMLNARKGVGYMVEAARKVLDFDRVYAGIIAIGIAAFLFRFCSHSLEKRLFPWRQGHGHAFRRWSGRSERHRALEGSQAPSLRIRLWSLRNRKSRCATSAGRLYRQTARKLTLSKTSTSKLRTHIPAKAAILASSAFCSAPRDAASRLCCA